MTSPVQQLRKITDYSENALIKDIIRKSKQLADSNRDSQSMISQIGSQNLQGEISGLQERREKTKTKSIGKNKSISIQEIESQNAEGVDFEYDEGDSMDDVFAGDLNDIKNKKSKKSKKISNPSF